MLVALVRYPICEIVYMTIALWFHTVWRSSYLIVWEPGRPLAIRLEFVLFNQCVMRTGVDLQHWWIICSNSTVVQEHCLISHHYGEIMQEVWYNRGMELIETPIASMARRVQAVIDAKGGKVPMAKSNVIWLNKCKRNFSGQKSTTTGVLLSYRLAIHACKH